MAFKIQIAGAEELAGQQFVTEVIVERSLYEHTRATVTLRWQEHTRYGDRQTAHLAAKVLNCPIEVLWKDNDLVSHVPCFRGYVESAVAKRDATSSRLVLSCIGYSKRTDLVPRYRTFQATTLLDIAQHIAGREPLVKIANAGDLAQPITLSVQYGETDFEYLSRMLHAWGVPMSVHDHSGEVMLGARGTAPSETFPDIGFGWTEVEFMGALQPLPKAPGGGGGGPSAQVLGRVNEFLGQLSRTAADYFPTPDSPTISDKVHGGAGEAETSGYHLKLEGAVLAFEPGQVVTFEGQSHLIHGVRVHGHPEQTTATQEFKLQPLTLPITPERRVPKWPSRAVWAHVTENENDPHQQGRIQVEFEWEDMDPQASGERAWLHVVTHYGGGSGEGKKSGQYAGFYSTPEVGERALVEFVGDWDSEAVVLGVVRQHPVNPPMNPKHTKRWRTPSGNEMTMSTVPGAEVVRVKTGDKLMFEGRVGGGNSSVTMICGESDTDMIHFQQSGGTCRLDIACKTDIFIQAGNHIEIEGKTVTIRATGGDSPQTITLHAPEAGIATSAKKDITSNSSEGMMVLTSLLDIVASSGTGAVGVSGKAGVGVYGEAGVEVGSTGGVVAVDGQQIHLNGS